MHQPGRLIDPARRVVRRQPLEGERKADDLAHAHMGVERIRLKDDPDIAVTRLHLVDHMPGEAASALARGVDASQHEECRRLAAVGGTKNGDELAGFDDEVGGTTAVTSPRCVPTRSSSICAIGYPLISPTPIRIRYSWQEIEKKAPSQDK